MSNEYLDWMNDEMQERVYPGSLHNHTCYSNIRLRDSINRIPDLLEYAEELHHSVIAFTEHDCISNAIKIEKAYGAFKEKHPDSKLKVILGNEIYLVRDGLNAENFDPSSDRYFHFILLAKDAIGHQQIRELSTRAWLRSYVAKGQRRVPTYYSDLIEIVGKNPGHVIGSTACLGGFLDTCLVRWGNNRDSSFHDGIIKWIRYVEDIFGDGNFYLEMQPSRTTEQVFVNQQIKSLSKALRIPYIITTDSHYLKKEDAPIHEAYLNSEDGDREVKSFYETTYMMGTDELESYMDDYMGAEDFYSSYQTIQYIADQCETYSLLKELVIPRLLWKEVETKSIDKSWFQKIPWLQKFYESDFEGDNLLARAIVDRIKKNPEEFDNVTTYNALDDCLEKTWVSSEVNKAHWSSYFLNLQKTIEECWNAGTLVGPGRGSGVGFLLLDILDIIQINCTRETTETFSFRFLNPNRVSVLDVDVDIEGSKRQQVLNHLRQVYGEDRVSQVATFKTEKAKAAIQTAARGLGINVDIANSISALVPEQRGQSYTLSQCFYGDKEKDIAPVAAFRREMTENYPELWEVAQKIEGLVCGVGIHAGGVIFVDEPFTNSTALMRAPKGTIITQFDLHDDEAVSLIKIDLLSIEALDNMHTCIDLLIKDGLITPGRTLKETYENVVGIYNLERTSPEMWKMVWNHQIQSLFQMEKESGIRGIALTKPSNVDELAVLNSVIRLMAQEKGAEAPLNKFARYKNDISLWYKEMTDYGLTPEEQKILEPVVKRSFGIAESQEKIMSLVQIPECGGFDLSWGDRLRKAVAKKAPKDYLQLEKEYYERVEERGLSKNLCNYVWKVLIAMSRGYSFNASHCLAYSLVGLQEMNLAYQYPIIYWNCACLITNSGGNEDTSEESDDDTDSKNKSNNYGKIAMAIGKMRNAGVMVTLPDINTSSYTFKPDAKNNQIVFGMRGMMNVGDDLINTIIANRPYSSVKDFYYRIRPNKQAMVSLIKAGAFDNLMDRQKCMIWYIWETCNKKTRITLQNMEGLKKYKLLPKETAEQKMAFRVYEFNRYLKACCMPVKSADRFTLTERAINFLTELGKDELIAADCTLELKSWKKIYDGWMDVYRTWIAANKDELLNKLNYLIFYEDWEKYALGNVSTWEMAALGFYYHEHELARVNNRKYGFVDYEKLPEEPEIDRRFTKGDKVINMYKLVKICGTCIDKNKNKGTVTLLTTTGVVNVKFRKEYFSLFDKQISRINPDGTKTVVERSWFNKGNMIVVMGIRSGNDFIVKKYASSVGEQLYHIDKINPDGTLDLRHERYEGNEEDDNG